MKFLLVFKPWTGRYFEDGTDYFLWLQSYEKMFAALF